MATQKGLVKFKGEYDKELVSTYSSIMNTLDLVCDKVLIGGGAVRDLIYNRKPKDLDIFYRLGPETNKCFFFEEFLPEELQLSLKPIPLTSSGEANTSVKLVDDKNFKYDFIQTGKNHWTELIAKFDFSFNQAVIEDGEVFVTQAFIKTYETGEVTFGHKTVINPKVLERLETFKKSFTKFDFSKIDEIVLKKQKEAEQYFMNSSVIFKNTKVKLV